MEIVECEEEVTNKEQPRQLGDGEFELLTDKAAAGSVDDCLQALLDTNFPALRDALNKHLAEWPKKRVEG